MTTTMDRRAFVRQAAILGGGLAALGPLSAFYARTAAGARLQTSGYGPLVLKGDLWLPADFDYAVLSRQGEPMSDGRPTPGIFDGMGAFPSPNGRVAMIRNHENRERAGEQKVVTGSAFEYDEAMLGGNTKLVAERDGATGAYSRPVDSYAILGGTSTNCAGGLRAPHTWITCEEVVKRGPTGKKHGYVFEIDSRSDGPVQATPVPQAGRMVHEAALERAGIVYETEDRNLSPDPVLGTIGACFYRYVPKRGGGVPLAETTGPLEALAIRGEPHANMDVGRVVGRPYPVVWVPVEEPDHEDDTDERRDRVAGFTPTRIQAQDNGAAYFDRQEGMWAGRGKIYFDCTTGGAADLGQVWEYDAGRETITLVYESVNPAMLQSPDNVVVVQQTGDIFLQEDSEGEQFVRGVTRDGEIYDFARTATNHTEFAGGCFSPDGSTFFVNQQGERGGLPDGPPNQNAVTYAIWGPFQRRH
jgi:uncharacterized protein